MWSSFRKIESYPRSLITLWKVTSVVWVIFSFVGQSKGQHSIARLWNEALLESIREDFARPTVHARNLFHLSVAMYDAWAVYDADAETFFLGRQLGTYTNTYTGIEIPIDTQQAQVEAISYACYRLLRHRFAGAPGYAKLKILYNDLMAELGFDTTYSSTDYSQGTPAALGNYLAEEIILFGLQDGSNEDNDYANRFYEPSNKPLEMDAPGNPEMTDPNRWQQLKLKVFIDQSGNILPITARDFIGPEWGQVYPFALAEDDLTVYQRDGFDYWVYHDPGAPPSLDTATTGDRSDDYQWGFALVAAWSAHLDPSDEVIWDISPGSIGNITSYPTNREDLREFYHILEGGDAGIGHEINPHTGLPYEPQEIPRGDYARVLAEFWADGPDSETPPGHWFTILNYVSDHPQLIKKFGGVGSELDDLEWDVKAYLTLGGAMHDVAITAWGIKGWYDYVRPVSAIRYMADKGQSSDPNAPSYHPAGIPLIPGRIELVHTDDILAGTTGEHIGKVKLRAWRGPNFIFDPDTDVAGVGWILAENWWPYQRPSFVTPPFAGYISGHSTYSSAAAVVLERLTGDPFFPGGLGEFAAPKNEFLVFENGPSRDMTLQWATYKDAADQCSLSRIWGGIHPPVDDMPGRLIGVDVGQDAFEKARRLFYKDKDEDGYLSYEDCNDNNPDVHPGAKEVIDSIDNDCDGWTDSLFTDVDDFTPSANTVIWPNPADQEITVRSSVNIGSVSLFNLMGFRWNLPTTIPDRRQAKINLSEFDSGIYYLELKAPNGQPIGVEKLVILH